jgi:hypothetical protein
MQRIFLGVSLTGLLLGCAHSDLPVAAIWPTQQQLTSYSERALAAMSSPEGIRLPSGGITPVVGTYDPTKPIRYWTEETKRQTLVHVQIPTKSGSSYSYTTITFDSYSGQIVGAGWGLIH